MLARVIPALTFQPQTMPPAQMMSSLKTVAEAVIGLLTMLLQFMIQQLELMPDDAETPSEMMGVMNGMVQELQNQRAMLQNLMHSSQDGPKRNARGSTGDSTVTGALAMEAVVQRSPTRDLPATAMPDPSQVPIAAQRASLPLQRTPLSMLSEQTPIGSRTVNWQLIEETEEEVVLDLEGRNLLGPNVTTTSDPNLMGSTGSMGPMLPRASNQLTLSEWGQCRVTWGKKHKGKTYQQVLTWDPSYYQWAVARFHSLTPEQQDFVRFCQVQMDADRRQ